MTIHPKDDAIFDLSPGRSLGEWLRDREDPEVLDFIEGINAEAEKSLASLSELETQVELEIRRRSTPRDISAKIPWGPYFYYSRQEKDHDYLIHCRQRRDRGAKEEILLDENELAAGHGYASLRLFEVSPDHRYLAYAVDTSGNERLTLRLRDLSEGSEYEVGESIGDHAAWAADSETLFYCRLDAANRPHRVYGHRLGSPAEDRFVFEEPDESYRIKLASSSSGDYIFLISGSLDSTEIYVLEARSPSLPFKLLRPRQPAMREAITHRGEDFFILRRSSPGNCELRRGPVHGRGPWRLLAAPEDPLHMERVLAFADFLVLFARRNGLSRVWVLRISDEPTDWVPVKLPQGAVLYPEENRDYQGSRLRLAFSALTTPYSVVVYDMAKRVLTVEKEAPVGDGFDRENYISESLHAAAPDGVSIPITLVYRRGMRRPEGNPLVLYAYGAYGYCVEPEFDPALLSLLDRGVIYAIAHVRGGGELGKKWHEGGRLEQKKNSFRDCIACAEFLLRSGYGAKGRLGLIGESAGGLLAGAVINERPELFAAVAADCPFVDPYDTLSDPGLPLSVSDWQEFGDPRSDPMGSYIRSYSPCSNIDGQAYPAIYATAGLQDPRVAYWEPIKWVHLLRESHTGPRPIILEIDIEGGHWGASSRSQFFRQTARKFAFLLHWLDIANPDGPPVNEKRAAIVL